LVVFEFFFVEKADHKAECPSLVASHQSLATSWRLIFQHLRIFPNFPLAIQHMLITI